MADEKTKNGRVLRIVLVVSLALNLAVVGLVAGSFASGRVGDGPPRSFDLGLGPMSRALAPEDRREIGTALRHARPMGEYNPRRQVTLMIATLRATPFDPEALRDLIVEQAEHGTQIQNVAQDVVIDHITTMSDESRVAFADRLQDELTKVRPRPERN
ncbi:hypothetical protein DS901_03655 [Loktanella sp. D2R18]|uniref:periplasmic heavy metal sensor n=1 Tax=Rhodobacterales TaxID=204455 RepID=UPI000DEB07EC|nr:MULTISPECIES: periplasmic heavy metal sensor [Rhodobacterales]MDO6589247.1 periplasmic heavy metal sensor [Yoonia sp. 1_MG-2023]RBW45329.1 hypothetical protein DS901_03655 [Loktanella sp. D2R18]